ncbi:hypothetical protein Tco_0698696 [Tanacetum coccineum]
MEYCEDEDDYFKNFETKFPAIVLDNTLTFDAAISCGPTVSPLNDNEIVFRISFDESDDEDYTIVYDENSFSYKIIFVNNLKMDSENDNDKVNMPSFPSPEPEEVDINKKTENQAKMTKLSMEWKRLCKIKAKVQKCQSQSQYRRISSQTGAGTEEYYWMQS